MAATTQSLQVLGLTPNQNYTIEVFATKTDAANQVHISPYSPRLQISTPSLSGDGNNLSTTNYGTDIKLGGGSIYAGTLTGTGIIDPLKNSTDGLPVSGVVSGSGLLVNQYGLAGYASGKPEFYIDSRTGSAYFAGTIKATIIESDEYSSQDPTDGSAYSSGGMAINLKNGSITAKQFRIDTSGNAYFGGTVSGAVWDNSKSLAQYIGYISQTAANGKNSITYGATSGKGKNNVSVSATAGFAPDGNVYASSAFPSSITASLTNQQAGDTFFSFNSDNNIIAQYTASNSTTWLITIITSTVIGNLDAGKITTGTLSAISLYGNSISGATISGSTLETPHFSGTTTGWTGVGITSSGNNDSIQFSYEGSIEAYISYNPTIDDGSFYISGPGSNSLYLGNGGITLDDPSTIILTAGLGVTITAGSSSLYVDDAIGAYLSSSSPSGSNGLRNISLTSTSGTPAASGNDGDIVLVYT